MPFLTPLFLALGLLAGPIILLYMLKLRRREVEVSSTMLWQLLLRDREANAPWQKLKRNLLLLLQLLLLLALVLALARPFFYVPAIASGTVVVLLDGSASMNATDAAPTRFEAARAAVRQLIDGLSPDARMSLILVGQQPVVLASATGDKEALRQALGQAKPAETAADWESAIALAAGAVRAGSTAKSTVVIISDGGLPTKGLPPLAGEVRYLPIGQSANNLAISALALRATDQGPQLFASVANYGTSARQAIISIYIDGELYTAQKIDVPAGGSTPLVVENLPQNSAAYTARLSAPPPAKEGDPLDALPLDDVAYAVYQPPSAGRALVVTNGNTFLEQVLAAFAKPLGLQPFRLRPGEAIPAEPFDLYIIDSLTDTITSTLPAGDLLLINPKSNELFEVGAPFTVTREVRVTNDALAQNVDWSNVNVLKANAVVVPTWARVIVETEGRPLVFAGEVGGRRVAVINFDLKLSDLPLRVTFPVLMANLLNYLAPAQAFSAPDGLRPGETLTIRPGSNASTVTITDPQNQSFAAPATAAGVIFADTYRLGFYRVRAGDLALGQFAVNLFDPTEATIQPATAVRVGANDVTATAREEQGQFELWPWLAGLGLIVLFIEWWIYHRGTTLPAVSGWRGIFLRKKTVKS